MTAMQENLNKAQHSMEFLIAELQAASIGSTAVEFLVLLPMIDKAAALRNDLTAFANAVEACNG